MFVHGPVGIDHAFGQVFGSQFAIGAVEVN